MTYSTADASDYSGAPVEFYLFTIGATNYGYTNSQSEYTFDGTTFVPTQIKRSDVEYLGDMSKQGLQIECPRDLGVVTNFIATPPQEPVSVTVYRHHETELIDERQVIWVGRVLNVTWENSKAVIDCESVFTSLKRLGLRRRYQRSCPHVLYGNQCKVVKSNYATTGTATAISGLDVTVAEAANQADGYYSGGILEWTTSAGFGRKVMIENHVGSTLTMLTPVPDLNAGTAVTIYPGCRRTTADCVNKFNNLENYGGMPYIPLKSVFGSSAF